MAAENVKVVCDECESVVVPGEDVIVRCGGRVVHAKCALCASCDNPFDKYVIPATDTIPRFDYAMVHGRPFHMRCLICHDPQCTDDINAGVIAAYPEFFVWFMVKYEDGMAGRVMHTWCHGCVCEGCVKDRKHRMEKPVSRWESDFSVQKYGDTVLDPAHRECNTCHTRMGSHGTGWRERRSHYGMAHVQCAMCNSCIRAGEREIKDKRGLSVHETCLTCPVCCVIKEIGLNTRRRFVMNADGDLVHNDCVQCIRCGVAKDGYYTRPVANFTHVEGQGYIIDPATPHVLVHENCPKGASKRKRDAEPVDPFARTRSGRARMKLK